MRDGIHTASTPLPSAVRPVTAATRAQPLIYGQRPPFGDNANNTPASETNLNGISLPGQSSGSQGMPIVLLPRINPEGLRQKEREKREETESQILYKKGEFLAVRNVDKGFWLCRLNRDILTPKGQVRVQWLTESNDNKQVYTLSYDNNIEFECILTNVNLTKISNYRYHLSKSEWERIDEILNVCCFLLFKNADSKFKLHVYDLLAIG